MKEIVPLFEFINHSHTTDDPLYIQGVDITLSNGSYAFSRILFDLISPLDPIYAKEVRLKDSVFSAIGLRKWTIGNIMSKEENDIFRKMKEDKLSDYTQLVEFIRDNKEQFTEGGKGHIENVLYYLQSRIDYIFWSNRDSTYMANAMQVDPSRKKSVAWLFKQYRDYLMSQNLRFLSEVLYPNEKIIVWAQNAHIKKYPNRMPFELSKIDSTYSIGLFCYSGKGCYTFGQGFDGTPPDSLIYEFKTPQDPMRIEQILYISGHENTFIDMLYQNKNDGNSWMFEKSKYADWDGSEIGVTENIRNTWDGLIVVKEISPPEYLDYQYNYLDRIK